MPGRAACLQRSGMHTQDPVSGNFSLAAPEAIVVKGGEMLGSVKAVISGNFFDASIQGKLV